MSMGMPGQPGFDAKAAFTMEREALGIFQHEFIGEKAERELLGDAYPESTNVNDFVDISK